MGAYVIDQIVLTVLVVVAVVTLVSGPTELVSCDLDADGDVAVFDEDAVRPGICEQPTGGTILVSLGIGALSVAFWFVYRGWEGSTGKTVGKLALGIRVVDQRTMEPIGVGRGIGRGLLGPLMNLLSCGLGALVDLLWPLWDARNQTLHDKAVSAVVVGAVHARPTGATTSTVYGGYQPPAWTPPPPAHGAAPTWPPTGPPIAPPPHAPAPPPPPPPPPAPPPPVPPGSPGSPTDPFGGPPPSPFG